MSKRSLVVTNKYEKNIWNRNTEGINKINNIPTFV